MLRHAFLSPRVCSGTLLTPRDFFRSRLSSSTLFTARDLLTYRQCLAHGTPRAFSLTGCAPTPSFCTPRDLSLTGYAPAPSLFTHRDVISASAECTPRQISAALRLFTHSRSAQYYSRSIKVSVTAFVPASSRTIYLTSSDGHTRLSPFLRGIW
jgi:hypothetical protein